VIPKQIKISAKGSKGFGPVLRYVLRADEPGADLTFGTLNYDPIRDEAAGLAEELTWEMNDRELEYRQRGSGYAARAGNPVFHMVMSWQDGEHPTGEQAQEACAHMMKALDMADHQAAWAIHRDTDHDHVHLVINRVKPDGRHMAEVPSFSKLKLHKAAREIEIAQGWRRADGAFVTLDTEQGPEVVRMSRAERRERGLLAAGPQISPGAADAAHREAGASFQAWAASGPAKAIKAALDTPGVTWERLHQQAAKYGLRIEPKGSGMVVTTRLDDGRTLAAKASQLGRWASKAELEKRLGPWQPPPDKLPAASVNYQKLLDAGRLSAQADGPVRGLSVDDRMARRLERSAARKALAARFKAEQEAARQDRPKQRADLVQQHRAERAALAVQLREERKAMTAQARQGGQLQAVGQSLWALRAAQQREALQKRQAAERKALSAKLPKQEVWRKWLEREAAQGDEAAQAALRGIRYREQRKKNQQIDGIEGEELDPLRKLTLAGLEAEIDRKRQLVLYRDAQGRDRFTDTGPRIVMHDKGDDSLEAALRLAAQKYGGKVDITGSSEFRERAARQAVRLGIEVMDTDLQAVVQDEKQRMQRPQQLSPQTVEKSAREVAKPLNPQAETGPPEMRAVDAALVAWQQAQTGAARTRAVQDWMQGMERIEQQGGDVAAANAHSRKALGGRYAGFMQEVGGAAKERQRDRGMER